MKNQEKEEHLTKIRDNMTREEKVASARKSAKALKDAKAAGVATPDKPLPKKEKVPPTRMERLKTMARGMIDDVKGIIPEANEEYMEARKKKIDKAVDG